ncbi:lambda exonuclease family protein [Luteimonas sp. TWI662]|uniref:lambda exonuclease family protein n=1 Tax=Luteimonas sp. TWI662 TaxID=3136789 RepID=UPI003208ACE4
MADLRWEPGEVFKSGPRRGEIKPPPLTRQSYIDQILAELLTGRPKEQASAKSLEWGHEMEPEAIAAYERQTGRLVEQVGFMRHPEFDFIGASPDLLIDDDGGGEIKCPMSIVVHAATLRRGLPPEHIEQIQGGLWVTGRLWWDFISYNPLFPEHLQLYVQRVHRDNAYIGLIKRDCLSAWAEVQEAYRQLMGGEG